MLTLRLKRKSNATGYMSVNANTNVNAEFDINYTITVVLSTVLSMKMLMFITNLMLKQTPH